jgi:choline dehydrogenase-like flavoprotein
LQKIALEELPAFGAQVCVVGAGPIGLAAAGRLAARGLKVLVLEAGDGTEPRGVEAPSVDQIVGDQHAPLSLALASGLGGTSQLWGGRCLPLDPIDFEAQRHEVGSWPIKLDEVTPYYEPAAAFLACGPARFTADTPGVGGAVPALRLDQLERWCDEPRLSARLARIALPDSIAICLGARATRAIRDASGRRIAALQVDSPRGPARVEATVFIFAGGGVETTRLLLAIQAEHPDLFGGVDGPLGRYYMGHLSGSIAEIEFTSRRTAQLFRYHTEQNSVVRRRFTFDRSLLLAEHLPNIAFYPDNPRLADASHGQGVLSALYLLLAAPGIGSRLLPEAILRAQLLGASGLGAHLRNVISDAPRAIAALGGLAWQRVAKRRRKPSLFLAGSGAHPLHFHAEHLPNPESRVTLAAPRSDQGLPPLRIELRFQDDDAAGVARAHEHLDVLLREAGLGRLVFKMTEDLRMKSILEQAQDGYHQIGLARMGHDPSDGVVDRDCKAFGLDNLYIAGSAVFRTSGQANPTFFATALVLRTADRVAAQLAALAQAA